MFVTPPVGVTVRTGFVVSAAGVNVIWSVFHGGEKGIAVEGIDPMEPSAADTEGAPPRPFTRNASVYVRPALNVPAIVVVNACGDDAKFKLRLAGAESKVDVSRVMLSPP